MRGPRDQWGVIPLASQRLRFLVGVFVMYSRKCHTITFSLKPILFQDDYQVLQLFESTKVLKDELKQFKRKWPNTRLRNDATCGQLTISKEMVDFNLGLTYLDLERLQSHFKASFWASETLGKSQPNICFIAAGIVPDWNYCFYILVKHVGKILSQRKYKYVNRKCCLHKGSESYWVRMRPFTGFWLLLISQISLRRLKSL